MEILISDGDLESQHPGQLPKSVEAEKGGEYTVVLNSDEQDSSNTFLGREGNDLLVYHQEEGITTSTASPPSRLLLTVKNYFSQPEKASEAGTVSVFGKDQGGHIVRLFSGNLSEIEARLNDEPGFSLATFALPRNFAILTPQPGQTQKVQAKPNQHYRITDSDNLTLKADVIAIREGDDLVLRYADNTVVVLEGYYLVCIDEEAGCEVSLPDGSGESVIIATQGTALSDGRVLVYVDGDLQGLLELAQGNQEFEDWLYQQLIDQRDLAQQEAAQKASIDSDGIGGGTLAGIVGVMAAATGGSGGGGGGGGGAGASAVGFILSGIVTAGPVIAGHGLEVSAYDANGNLLGTTSVGDDGRYTLTITRSYSGLILIRVADTNAAPDYRDEASKARQDLKSDLRVIIEAPATGATKTVNINPLTELATIKAGLDSGDGGTSHGADSSTSINTNSITTKKVKDEQASVAKTFGLKGDDNTAEADDLISTIPIPTVNADGSDNTANANEYGKALATISGVENEESKTTVEVLTELKEEITEEGLSSDAGDRLEQGAQTAGSSVSVQLVVVPPIITATDVVGSDRNDSYREGDEITITLSMSQAVTVDTTTGVPRIAITIGTVGTVQKKYANYSAPDSTDTQLVFIYTIEAGDTDTDGIGVAANVDLNGGSIKDVFGNDATLTRDEIDTLASHQVDTTAPTITGIPAINSNAGNDGTYKENDVIEIRVTFSEAVTVDESSGTPSIGINIGGVTQQASYESGSGSTTLTFQYTVQAGDTDAGGISLAQDSLGLNRGTIKDSAGNNATLTHGAVVDNNNHKVDTTAPTITGIPAINSNAGNDGTYKENDVIEIRVTFSEAVTVDESSGTPSIGINIGGVTQQASYESGSGSRVLTFQYTVQAGDNDAGGISLAQDSLGLNRGTIKDSAGNNATLTHGAVVDNNNHKVDTTAPTITGIPAINSNAGNDGTYKENDVIEIRVTFSEAVTVDETNGTPSIGINIGGVTQQASYESGSGSRVLTFQYTVQAGDTDAGGISLAQDSLGLNSGTIKDSAGNNATLTHGAVVDNNNHKVDTTAPTITGIPAINSNAGNDGTYKENDVIEIRVTFSEAVTVDESSGTPSIGINIGGVTQQASYESGSGSRVLTFQYTVQAGDNDAGGISLAQDSLGLNRGTIKDSAGNNATLTHGAVVDNNNHKVDTTAPTITGIPAINSNAGNDGTYKENDVIEIRVTFSEAVTVDETNGTPSIGINIGGVTQQASYESGSGSRVLTFQYTVQAGDTDAGGISIVQDSLGLNSGTIKDSAGNNATLTHGAVVDNNNHKVDTTAPTITGIPAINSNAGNDGTYKENDVIEIRVTFSEAVTVDESSGTPSIGINIGGVTQQASYESGSGSRVLTFQYTVQAGDTDAGGISLAQDSLGLNRGTIKDSAGNNATLTHGAVVDNNNHKVDTTAPTITGIPAINSNAGNDGTYKENDVIEIRVTFSEAVTVDESSGTPSIGINIGGVTQQASYESGSGSRVLTFQYTVQAGDTDAGGISLAQDSLGLNRGTIKDSAGNNATLTHGAGVDNNNHKVDTTAPTITGIPAINSNAGNDGTYKENDVIEIRVTFSEAVTVDESSGTPSIGINIGGVTQQASYESGSGSRVLTFQYTVQAGDNDAGGISIAQDSLGLNRGTIKDSAGNNATLTHGAVVDNNNHKVDTTAPTITGIPAINSNAGNDGTYKENDVIEIRVTFSEAVTVDESSGTPSIGINIGGVTQQASYESGSGSRVLTFQYTVQAGDTDAGGISIVQDSLGLNRGTIKDSAGNNATLTHGAVVDNNNHKVDTTAPTITGIPAINSNAGNDGTYKENDVIEIRVTFSEAVTVDESSGTPSIGINIGGVTQQASYESGSGSRVLTFQYTVQAGDTDAGGISLAQDSLGLNRGTIKDSAGNNATLTHGAVVDNNNHKVDTTAPSVTGIDINTPRASNTFNTGEPIEITLTFNEAVTVVGTPHIFINISGTDKQADYVRSHNGNTELVFRYSPVVGDSDNNGISITAADIVLPGGASIKDTAGNDANLAHLTVVADLNKRVDAQLPRLNTTAEITGATDNVGSNAADVLDPPTDLGTGDITNDPTPTLVGTISTALNANEVIRIYNGATLLHTIDAATLGASRDWTYTLAALANGATLSFTAQVVTVDGDGDLTAASATSAAFTITIDTTPPTITGAPVISSNAGNDGTYKENDVIEIRVTFSEAVTVDETNGTPSIGINIGGVTQQASYESGSGSTTLTFQYTVQAGDNDAGGISIAQDSLGLNRGTIKDSAGNNATLTHVTVADSNTHKVDGFAPILDLGSKGTTVVANKLSSGVALFKSTVSVVDNAPIEEAKAAGHLIDTTSRSLKDIWYVAIAKIDGNTYALTGSRGAGGEGIQVIDITDPSTPTPTLRITNGFRDTSGNTFNLPDIRGITVVQVDGIQYALVLIDGAGASTDGVRIINISDPGSPLWVSSIVDSGRDTEGNQFTKLQAPNGITTTVIGGKTYALITAANPDNGVQIIDISEPNNPLAISAVTDGAQFKELSGALGVTTVVIGDQVYALVAAYGDSGVQIINISKPDTPTASDDINDDLQTELSGAVAVSVAVINGSTYAVVAANADDGIQILDISDPTDIKPVSQIAHGDIKLDGAFSVKTITIADKTYALVSVYNHNSIQVLDISDPLNPKKQQTIIHGANDFSALDGPVDIVTTVIAGRVYAVVTAIGSDGVQLIELPVTPTISRIAITVTGLEVSGEQLEYHATGTLAIGGNSDIVKDNQTIAGIDGLTIKWLHSSDAITITRTNNSGLTTVQVQEIIAELRYSHTGTPASIDDREFTITLTDMNGNTSSAVSYRVTVEEVDLEPPTMPGLRLVSDTGAAGDDGISNNGEVEVTGLEAGASWAYSVDGGNNWTDGSGSGFTLAEGVYQANDIQVRQTDKAGNVSEIYTHADEIEIDKTNPYVVVGKPDTPYLQIYILTGQSNSLGLTNNARDTDPANPPPDDNDQYIEFFWSNRSTVGGDGPSGVIGDSGGRITHLQKQQGEGAYPSFWGPEIQFARTLYAGGHNNFLIVKVSRGGGGNNYWLKSGQMYQHLIATINKMLEVLGDRAYQFVSLLYLQGESNGQTEASSAGDRFAELLNNLREDLPNADDMTAVIGGIAAANIVLSPHRNTTRARQKTLADNREDISYFSNLDLQDHLYDLLHFDKPAKLIVGKRYANKVSTPVLEAPDNGVSYVLGERVVVKVKFSENMYVKTTDGVPHIELTIGGVTHNAVYHSGSGSKVLVFHYTVTVNDVDHDGIYIAEDSLSLNGGVITDTAGNIAVITHGEYLSYPVGVVTVTGRFIQGSILTADTGVDNTVGLSYQWQRGSDAEGWEDIEGAVAKEYQLVSDDLGKQVRVVVGIGTGDQIQFITSDETSIISGPKIDSIAISSDAGTDHTYAVGDQIEVTLSFSQAVVVQGVPTIQIKIGNTIKIASYDRSENSDKDVVFTYTVVSGDYTDSGISIDAGAVGLPTSASIQTKSARGPVLLNYEAVERVATHKVDGFAPILDLGSKGTTVVANKLSSGVALFKSTVSVVDNAPIEEAKAAGHLIDTTSRSLKDIWYVAIAKIDGNTYALTGSRGAGGEGIQVIDITDPSTPTPTLRITNGFRDTSGNTFNLPDIRGITVVQVDGIQYALVLIDGAGASTDGVRIINISDPGSPLWVSSIVDSGRDTEGNQFTKLQAPNGITTTVIGGKTYALITAANPDNGVQIIDISEPNNPLAISAVTDGAQFKELSGALGVTTVVIGDQVYALVAAYGDSGVQIINISKPDTPTASDDINDDLQTELSGAVAVSVAVINGSTYAVVAANADDGIQILDISDPTDIKPVSQIAHGDIKLDGAFSVKTITIADKTYALVSVYYNHRIQILDISDPLNPKKQQTIIHGANDFSALDGPVDIVTTVIAGRVYAVVTAIGSDGVQLIELPVTPTISRIAITVTGLEVSGEQLEYHATGTLAIGGNSDIVKDNQTIAGIDGLTIKWLHSSDAITITRTNNSGLTTVQVQEIIAELRYSHTGTPASIDDREFTITLTDMNGNTSSAVSYRVTVEEVDLEPPTMPGLRLVSDTGAAGDDGISNNGEVEVTGLEAGASWAYSVDGGNNWTDGSGSGFTLAEGVYQANDIQVRQTDKAGNVSEIYTHADEIEIDKTNPYVVVGKPDTPYLQIYILTGQSNSLGLTNNARDTDPANPPPDDNDQYIEFFWSNRSTVGGDGPSGVIGDSGGRITHLQKQQGEGAYPSFWGPEIQFARTLYAGGHNNFLIVKVSRGGGGNNYWLKSGQMYQHLIATINKMLEVLGDRAYQFVSLLYLQGESNGQTEASSAGDRFAELLNNLREDLPNADDMTAVIGGIAAANIVLSPHRNTTRARQKTLADNREDISYFSNLDLQDHLYDLLHFDKPAKLIVGKRYANKVSTPVLEAPDNGVSYVLGERVVVKVKFSENMYVKTTDGVPHIELTIGGVTHNAVYHSGSGSKVLVFHYTVTVNDVDHDGIYIAEDSLSLNGGVITDTAGNIAVITHGEYLSYPVGVVTVTGRFIQGSILTADTGVDNTVGLSYQWQRGSDAEGWEDIEGAVAKEYQLVSDDLGKQVRVVVGIGTGDQIQFITSDETSIISGPKIDSIAISSDAGTDHTYAVGDQIEVTLSFSQAVVVQGVPTIQIKIGNTIKIASYDRSENSDKDVVFTYTVVSGDYTDSGISIDAGAVGLPTSASIQTKSARGPVLLNYEAVERVATHKVDGFAPILDLGSKGTTVVANKLSSGVALFKSTVSVVDNAPIEEAKAAGHLIDTTSRSLKDIWYVAIAKIDGNTYALTGSRGAGGEGIQVIDITDPSTPTPTLRITNGFRDTSGNTFNLPDIRGITVVQVDGIQYALVLIDGAGASTDGVRIINISDPGSPLWVSSIVDSGRDTEGNQFTKLQAPNGITTTVIGGKTYALITAANPDNGVQIIDISEPNNPLAISAVTDGAQFKELSGALGVTTVVIGDQVYALVAAYGDSGVQIINISKPDTPTASDDINDDLQTELSGAVAVSVAVINGSTYAVVAANADDGIQILDISDPTDIKPVSQIAHGDIKLDGAFSVKTITIADKTYALVSVYYNHRIQILDISDPLNPKKQQTIIHGANDFSALDGPVDIVTTVIAGRVYAVVTAIGSDGVQLIELPVTPTISRIAITVTGLEVSGEQLEYHATGTLAIGGNSDIVKDNQTIAGIDGLTIKWLHSSDAITITRTNNSGLTTVQVQEIIAELRYSHTGTPASIDDREFTITLTDMNGNTSSAVSYRVTVEEVDLEPPTMPGLRLVSDTGAAGDDGISNNGEVEVTGLEAGASWAYSVDGGNNWTDGSGSGFTLAEGVYQANDIQVRQTDKAGNVSEIYTHADEIEIDKTNPYVVVGKPDTPYLQIYILTGQSNSLGLTNNARDTDPANPPPDDNDQYIEFFWSNRSTVGGDGPSGVIGDSGGRITHLQKQQGEGAYPSFWGPEIQFARTLYAGGHNNFLIVKVSRGGGGNNYWLKSGQMYQHLIATINKMLEVLGDRAYQFVSLLYLQGESNGQTEASSAGDRFAELLNNLREDLPNADDMTAVIGGIAAANIVLSPHRNTTRARQKTLADNREDISYFSNLDLQDHLYDLLHFDKPAKLIVGKRYANKVSTPVLEAPDNGVSYVLGERVVVKVKFSENMYVKTTDGVPHIELTIGGVTHNAVYHSGSGSKVLVFHYTVTVNDVDHDGIYIAEDSLSLNGGVITDTAGNIAVITHGEYLSYPVGVVTVTGRFIQGSILTADTGVDNTVGLSYQWQRGSDAEGWEDIEGAVAKEYQLVSDDLGKQVRVVVGIGTGDQIQFITSDETSIISGPKIDSIAISSDAGTDHTYAVGDQIEVTLSFSQAVVVQGVPTIQIKIGNTIKIASYDRSENSDKDVVFTYTVVSGDYTDSGISIDAGAVGLPTSASIQTKSARGPVLLNYEAVERVATHKVDGFAPILDLGSKGTTVVANKLSSGVALFKSTVSVVDNAPIEEAKAAGHLIDTTSRSLKDIWYVAIAKIDGNTYALTGSRGAGGEGIQVIDITDPSTPTPTLRITNGFRDTSGNTFNLPDIRGITVVQVDGIQYALVLIDGAGASTDGVRIINISDPGSPLWVSSIVDSGRDTEGNQFTKLQAPNGITTTVIGGKTYALITAANPDNGVQIIDISEPNNPLAISAVTDGAQFKELSGALGVTTVVIGDQVYALVAAYGDSGVQIINISKPDTPTASDDINDDLQTELSGAVAVSVAVINGSTYAVVAANADDGIQILDISDPTDIKPVSQIAHGDIKLDGAFSVKTITIADKTYALVSVYYNHRIQILDISDPLNPKKQQTIIHGANDFSALDGPVDIVTTVIAGRVYAVVTAIGSDGVQLIELPVTPTISRIAITVTGLEVSGEQLEYHATGTLAIGGNSDIVKDNQTIAGIDGLTIKWLHSSDAITITRTNNSGLTTVQVQEIIAELRYSHTGTPASIDDREFTITLTDMNGNTSSAVSYRVTVEEVDLEPPTMPGLRLVSDTGAAGDDGISNNGEVEVTGLEAGASWAYSVDGGNNWTDGSGSGFTLAEGVYQANDIQVRQTDKAGNVSEIYTHADEIEIDKTNPYVVVGKPDTPYLQIYILTGQSNSLGLTNNARDTDPANPPPDDNDQYIEFFWSNRSTVGGDGPSGVIGDSGGRITHLQKQQGEGAYPSFWGPEIQFARTLYAGGHNNFLIVKVSRGGGGNNYWLKSGQMYQHLIATINKMLEVLGDRAYQFVSLLYLQGESNGQTEASSAGDRFAELLNNLREDLPNADDMTAVIGGIAAANIVLSPHRNTTRARQKTLADNREDISYFSNLDLQDHLYDLLHFDKPAKLIVGKRYANKVSTPVLEAPDNGVSYVLGERVVVKVKFSENMYVKTTDGVPHIELTIGGVTHNAVYHSGSGSKVLVFHYTVTVNDVDHDGIYIAEDSLSLNGGVITDTAGNIAVITHGEYLSYPVGVVTVTGRFIQGSILTADTGVDNTVGLSYQWQRGSDAEGWEDIEGAVAKEYQLVSDDLGKQVRVVVGIGTGDQIQFITSDETSIISGPKIDSIAISSDAGTDHTYAVGDQIEVTLSFSQAVVVQGVPTIQIKIGNTIKIASYDRSENSDKDVVFTYTVVSGDYTDSGISIDAGAVGLPTSASIQTKSARGPVLLNYEAVERVATHKVDGFAPILDLGSKGTTVVANKLSSGVALFKSTVSVVDNAPIEEAKAAGHLIDTTSRSLKDIWYVAIAKIDGNTYALTGSRGAGGEGIQVIDITDPSTPTPTLRITNGFRDTSGNTFNLPDIRGITVVQVDGIQYALVLIDGAGASTDGVRIINISDPGSPLWVSSIVDSGRDTEGNQFTKLQAPNGITTTVIGGKTYALITAANPDNGVQIIDISEPNNPLAISAVTDGAQFKELSGALGVTTVVIGDQVYALVAAYGDSGVQIINISKPDTPTASDDINDDLQTELSGAVAVSVAVINGSTYAVVAANADDGIQILDISDPTDIKPVSQIAHGDIKLDGAFSVKTITIADKTYALVSVYYNHRIQILDISDPLNPKKQQTIIHGANDFSALDGPVDIVTTVIAGRVYAVVTAIGSDGVQLIELPVTPTISRIAITVTGLEVSGEQLEYHATGTLAIGGNSDIVKDNQTIAGIDGLTIKWLHSSDAITITRTNNSGLTTVQVQEIIAELRYSHTGTPASIDDREFTITLTDMNGNTSSAVSYRVTVEEVDLEPPTMPAPSQPALGLVSDTGVADDDTLRGKAGDDRLIGGDGDNTLWGGAGDDELYGGAGDDTLIGGAGIDLLIGGAGADRFVLDTNALATDTDTITDFHSADGDRIQVDTMNGDETTLAALGLAVLDNPDNDAHANIVSTGDNNLVYMTLNNVDHQDIINNFANYFSVI